MYDNSMMEITAAKLLLAFKWIILENTAVIEFPCGARVFGVNPEAIAATLMYAHYRNEK